jgi:hypothetical protein
VGSFDVAVQLWPAVLDVGMPDTKVVDMSMERDLELVAIMVGASV